MLLKSSNEMALTLAENYKGGYDGFIEAMNKRAKKDWLYESRCF